MEINAEYFLNIGAFMIRPRQSVYEPSRQLDARFNSIFGVNPFLCARVWRLMLQRHPLRRGAKPIHLLWVLMFLKSYETEASLSMKAQVDEKTLRKWVWYFVQQIADLTPRVVSPLSFQIEESCYEIHSHLFAFFL
jgi:hypothetical protein